MAVVRVVAFVLHRVVVRVVGVVVHFRVDFVVVVFVVVVVVVTLLVTLLVATLHLFVLVPPLVLKVEHPVRRGHAPADLSRNRFVRLLHERVRGAQLGVRGVFGLKRT